MYLSSESTLSFRDAGFPPTRVRGFLGTTGSIGLSDSDERCFSIFHFYEHSVAGCECINVYCEKSFLSVCVSEPQSGAASCDASAAAFLSFIYIKEAAMTEPTPTTTYSYICTSLLYLSWYIKRYYNLGVNQCLILHLKQIGI